MTDRQELEVELVEIDGETLMVVSWPTVDRRSPLLTAAERAVLDAVAAGMSNGEIARARKTSVRTIANQIASLFRKLRVGSRHELVAALTAWEMSGDEPPRSSRARRARRNRR